jgi:hypothetical protein
LAGVHLEASRNPPNGKHDGESEDEEGGRKEGEGVRGWRVLGRALFVRSVSIGTTLVVLGTFMMVRRLGCSRSCP